MSVETRSTTLAVPAGSGRNRTTLDPLWREGPDAITPANIPRLRNVKLREIHSICDNLTCDTYVRVADDLFAYGSAADGYQDLFPHALTVTKAVFAFFFADSSEPRTVILSPPDNIFTENQTDAEIVQQWALLHGFVTSPLESRRESDEQAMAIPG